MSDKKTLLVIVSDRSGSMGQNRVEYENAINKLLSDQKSGDGACYVTFAQFDTNYQLLYNYIEIEYVMPYVLQPGGLTALWDAVGKTINDVGAYLANMKEEDRPGFVNFVICTDGEENASREFKIDTLKQMIKEQTEKYSWVFTFLGVDINAEEYGKSMGIDNAVKISRHKSGDALTMLSGKMLCSRSAYAAGQSVQEFKASMNFSDEEKTELES